MYNRLLNQVIWSAAGRTGSKMLMTTTKTMSRPLTFAGDVMEYGVESLTGDRDMAKSASLGFYIGAGAAMGGPIGALGGLATWGLKELFS